MSLADSLMKWNQTLGAMRQERAERPYLNDIARANRDFGVSKASDMGNRAGLSGLELQFAPEEFDMRRQSHGLNNQLANLRIQQLQNNMATGGGYKPMSPFGKLQEDYAKVVQFYGADSPQAQEFKQMIQKQMSSNNGITMGVDENGRPLVKIGGSGGGSSGGGSGGLSLDPETGDIFSAPTKQRSTMEQASLGAHEDLQRYVNEAISVLPQFQSPGTKFESGIQGLANRYVGTQFDLPSQKRAGEAALKKTIDKFISTANLPKIESSVQLVKDIFTPGEDESESGYRNRLQSELSDLQQTYKNTQKRERQGYRVGNINSNKKSSLEKKAQEAIAKGADPAKVNARLQQLMGQ